MVQQSTAQIATTHRIGFRYILITHALVALIPSLLQADLVTASGRPATVNVEILSIRDGQLGYRLRTGRLITRPINQIDYLQISRWRLFNLAEKQRRDKHFRQSIRSYEKALDQWLTGTIDPRHSRLPHPAQNAPQAMGTETTDENTDASPLDRALLLKCRLLQTCDAQGRFDRAVELYLDLLQSSPEGNICAELLRPKNLPQPGSTFLTSATQQVQAAIDRHGPDTLGMDLARWRHTWPDVQSRPDEPDGMKPPSSSESTGPEQDRRVSEALANIRSLIDRERFDEALQQIDDWLSTTTGPSRAELYYEQARSLLGQCKEGGSPEAQPDRRRAGLALMRIVIHFPAHPLSPECLYRAAEICSKQGQKQQAKTLWSELIDRYPSTVPWTHWAKEHLTQWRATTSKPAP